MSSEGVDFKYFLVGVILKNNWAPVWAPCLEQLCGSFATVFYQNVYKNTL